MVFRECNVCLKRWPHGSASTCVCEEMTIKPRQWQGLTRQEFLATTHGLEDLEDCWMAIEAALRSKNT